MAKKKARKERTPTELEALLDLERVARAYYENDLLYVDLSARQKRRWDVKLDRALEAVKIARSVNWFRANPSGLARPISTDTASLTNDAAISRIRVLTPKKRRPR